MMFFARGLTCSEMFGPLGLRALKLITVNYTVYKFFF